MLRQPKHLHRRLQVRLHIHILFYAAIVQGCSTRPDTRPEAFAAAPPATPG
jgi:hypothetical protein